MTQEFRERSRTINGPTVFKRGGMTRKAGGLFQYFTTFKKTHHFFVEGGLVLAVFCWFFSHSPVLSGQRKISAGLRPISPSKIVKIVIIKGFLHGTKQR